MKRNLAGGDGGDGDGDGGDAGSVMRRSTSTMVSMKVSQ